MKASATYLFLILGFICFGNFSSAQSTDQGAPDVFVGKIVFELDTTKSDQSVLNKVSSEITLISDGHGRTRWEENMNGNSRIVITDLSTPIQHTLMTFLGKEVAIRTPEAQIIPQVEGSAMIDGCCIEIAGRSCSMVINDLGETCYIDFSKRHEFPGLPSAGGMTLGFNQSTNHGNAFYTAILVEEMQPDGLLFEINEDYIIIEASELSSLFSHTNSPAE